MKPFDKFGENEAFSLTLTILPNFSLGQIH